VDDFAEGFRRECGSHVFNCKRYVWLGVGRGWFVGVGVGFVYGVVSWGGLQKSGCLLVDYSRALLMSRTEGSCSFCTYA
jgi:hypothetical protein